MLTSFLSPFKKYRETILHWQGAETLLGTLRRKQTPEFMAGIAGVYGRTDTAFLDEIAWSPPVVPAPCTGYQLQAGRSANAHINRFGFRDRRESYAEKAPGDRRIFLTGGSVTFGSGAPSQEETIAGQLEGMLNAGEAAGPGGGWEIVNAGLPAASLIHEMILVQSRLLRFAPDCIVMLSGHNDIHYALEGRDPNDSFVSGALNFAAMIKTLYKDAGFSLPFELGVRLPRHLPPPVLAKYCYRNVMLAMVAANLGGCELVFALQPDIWSTPKALTPRERHIHDKIGDAGRAYWQACQAALRERLAQPPFPGCRYRFLDLSRLFAEVPGDHELFLDSCHFASEGNRLIAGSLANALAGRPA